MKKNIFICLFVLFFQCAYSQEKETISLEEAISYYHNQTKIFDLKDYDRICGSEANEDYILKRPKGLLPKELLTYSDKSLILYWDFYQVNSQEKFLCLSEIKSTELSNDECNSLFEKLKSKYGIVKQKESDKKGMIPVSWFDGEFEYISCPLKSYVGYVSIDKSKVVVDKNSAKLYLGKTIYLCNVINETPSPFGFLNDASNSIENKKRAEKNIIDICDDCWYNCHYYFCGMTCFMEYLNKETFPWYKYFTKKDIAKGNIFVLLYTDKNGKTKLHKLNKLDN